MDEFFIVQSSSSVDFPFPSYFFEFNAIFSTMASCSWFIPQVFAMYLKSSPSGTVKRKLRNCSQIVWYSFNWSLIGTPEIDPQAKQPNGTTLERLRQKIKIHSWKQRSDQQNNLAANKSMLCIGSLYPNTNAVFGGPNSVSLRYCPK